MFSLSTLCYMERDGKYLMLHRTVKKQDVNKDKWIGVGGHFEQDESPEECLIREVQEETGYTLTSWSYRAIVTFVSGGGVTEYMSLYTADDFTGTPVPCDEGELEWVDREEVLKLNIWEGDKIFFRLMNERKDFFSLKLVYDGGDRLVRASLDGHPMELLDVLDDKGEPTGVVRERGVAHQDGSAHGTAHVWIVREHAPGQYELLVQKRSSGKDSYPGCYDISAAGHVAAGDGYLESAIRELREELGITASPDELHFAGIRKSYCEDTFYGRPFRDQEFAHVYVYREEVDASRLVLQKEEVEEVLWIDFQECWRRVEAGQWPNCIYLDELELLKNYLEVTVQTGSKS